MTLKVNPKPCGTLGFIWEMEVSGPKWYLSEIWIHSLDQAVPLLLSLGFTFLPSGPRTAASAFTMAGSLTSEALLVYEILLVQLP